MNILSSQTNRVLSGMRPTGRLHLGHYHGVLKNWVKLQHEHPSFFFVADWHALTTLPEGEVFEMSNVWDMVVDWLASGIDPNNATLFIQSRVPEHAELHVLLSMTTPLSWLERVPTYKDMQEQLKSQDLATYGFLGYPLLQSADILIYKAGLVPVGEDQIAHVELTREIARRFNHRYGKELGFEELARAALKKMGKKQGQLYETQRRAYQERGDAQALAIGRALVENQPNISLGDKERLLGYLEGGGITILPEPRVLLTDAPRMPGLDGRKMSKSYHNTITLRDAPERVDERIRTMPTDPARIRLRDPGDPEKCPVWQLHKIYSDEKTRNWVLTECPQAGIGCVECKTPLVEKVQEDLLGFRERAKPFEADPGLVREIVADGCEKARDIARETLEDVRQAMGLNYR